MLKKMQQQKVDLSPGGNSMCFFTRICRLFLGGGKLLNFFLGVRDYMIYFFAFKIFNFIFWGKNFKCSLSVQRLVLQNISH